jgi:hypothetical protein
MTLNNVVELDDVVLPMPAAQVLRSCFDIVCNRKQTWKRNSLFWRRRHANPAVGLHSGSKSARVSRQDAPSVHIIKDPSKKLEDALEAVDILIRQNHQFGRRVMQPACYCSQAPLLFLLPTRCGETCEPDGSHFK